MYLMFHQQLYKVPSWGLERIRIISAFHNIYKSSEGQLSVTNGWR